MRGNDGNFSSYKLVKFLKQERIKEAKQYIDSCLSKANNSYFPINNFEPPSEIKHKIDKIILPIKIYINRKLYFAFSFMGFLLAFIIYKFPAGKHANDDILSLFLVIIIAFCSIYLLVKSLGKTSPKIIIKDSSIIVRKFIDPLEFFWSDVFHCSYHFYKTGKSGVQSIEVFLYLKNGRIFCFDIKQLDVSYQLILAIIKKKLTQPNTK